MDNVILYVFAIWYFIDIVLISIFDKINRKIDKKLLITGIIISLVYIIYVYLAEPTSIYKYLCYLGIYIILISLDTILLRKYAIDNYIINLLIFLNIMIIFWDYWAVLVTLIIFVLCIGIYVLKKKIKKPKTASIVIKYNEIEMGYYLGISNIIAILSIMIVNCLR